MRMGGITYKKCGKPNNLPCPKSPSMGAIWAGVNITCLAGIHMLIRASPIVFHVLDFWAPIRLPFSCSWLFLIVFNVLDSLVSFVWQS
jgi:hypothetical protein